MAASAQYAAGRARRVAALDVQEGEREATTPPPSPFYHNDSKTPVSVSSIPRIQHDELPNGDNDSSRIASPQPKEDSGNPGPQNLGMPPPPRNN